MSTNDFKQVLEIYDSLKTNRDRTKPLWDDISNFVGINVDTDYAWVNNQSNKSTQLDQCVDDPTSAISVNQAGDYLVGTIWGTGEGVFDLVPSRYVLEFGDQDQFKDYYDYATDQVQYHMSHPAAGYITALRPYAYDQFAFGTSGIGTFPNPGFKQKVDENALLFRQYGVDNVVIDEGKSGLVDYVFATYHWRVNRIVGEFATKDGIITKELFNKLPKAVRDSYKKGNLNEEFDIVFGMMPRQDFNPSLKGKKGTRYRGVWFMTNSNTSTKEAGRFFKEESFSEKPINIARMILVRGEVWGRSSGTMLLSSIRSVNYMIGTAIEVMEKMADPALGIFSNAIFGDSVLDTSPSGMTVFNAGFTGGAAPTFPLYDVGDPTALVQFLVPYLNEKITTAFKVDALLDFSSKTEMTATESIQRFIIRGQSLAGILSQQKNERSIPDVTRATSVLLDMGELGAKAGTARAQQLKPKRPERIIPDAVQRVMDSGRPWFEIRFNNELEKLIRTQALQNLMQILNVVGAMAALNPDIVEAVNWYKLLSEINQNLDANNQILLTEVEFKDKMKEIAQLRAGQLAMEAGTAGSQIAKNQSTANRNNQEASNVG